MDNENFGFGAMDKPDMRDWAPYRLGVYPIQEPPPIPEYWDGDGTYASNQGQTNHCTSHGSAGVVGGMATRLGRRITTADPELLWRNQLEYPGTAREDMGDFIQSALKAINKFGVRCLIDGKWKTVRILGYSRINPSLVKNYLAAGHQIITGAYWGKVEKPFYYLQFDKNKKFGHCFRIIGYDDTLQYKPLICMNSWGDKWGKKGRFLIKEEDIPKLFSMYIVKIDEESLNQTLISQVSGFFRKLLKR